jgi:hypothetical protein
MKGEALPFLGWGEAETESAGEVGNPELGGAGYDDSYGMTMGRTSGCIKEGSARAGMLVSRTSGTVSRRNRGNQQD